MKRIKTLQHSILNLFRGTDTKWKVLDTQADLNRYKVSSDTRNTSIKGSLLMGPYARVANLLPKVTDFMQIIMQVQAKFEIYTDPAFYLEPEEEEQTSMPNIDMTSNEDKIVVKKSSKTKGAGKKKAPSKTVV